MHTHLPTTLFISGFLFLQFFCFGFSKAEALDLPPIPLPSMDGGSSAQIYPTKGDVPGAPKPANRPDGDVLSGLSGFQITASRLWNFFDISGPPLFFDAAREAVKLLEVPPEKKILETRQAEIFSPLSGVSQSYETTATDSFSFSILSLNFWLLPWPVPINQEARIDKFAEIVQSEKPDLVALQEVWLFSYSEQIAGILKNYWRITPQPGIYNQTGLMIFSRWKPETADYGFFGVSPGHNLIEIFANKGYLRARFCLGKISFDVISSHIYSGRVKFDGNDIPDRQIRGLKVLTASTSIPVLIGTDLNTAVPDFQKLDSGHFVMESDLVSSTKAKTGDSKIDYILGRKPDGCRMTIETRVIREPVVSDHLPVFGKIRLEFPTAETR